MSQLSTAFSDLVLAAASVYGILQMTASSWDQYIYAVIGYALIWVAAVAGMIRFALFDPPCTLVRIHRALTWLGATLGLSLIAAQLYYKHEMDDVGHIHLALGILLLVVKLIADYRTSTTMSEFVSAVSAISMLLNSLLNRSPYGCLGAVSIILVGLMVGTRGRRLGMPSVDLFHYGLSIRHPPQIVVDVFHFFNGVVRTAAIALISAQFLQLHVQEEAAWVMSGIGVISLLVPRVLDSDDNEKFQDVAFLVAIMGLAYCCWVTKSLYGIAGTVVLMVGRFKDDLGSDD
uniref:Uncharacterized protein n=1 Tax=Strigamia maritima TaxID=126957 RepID=T1JHC1_STRMM